MRKFHITPEDGGTLSQGIKFADIRVGRRTFSHQRHIPTEYYLQQWKNTISRPLHPVGSSYITTDFQTLLKKLTRIL